MKYKFKCPKCNKEWEENIDIEKDFHLRENNDGFYEWQDYDEEESLSTYHRDISCQCGNRKINLKPPPK